MTLKKLLSFLLVISLTLSLSACTEGFKKFLSDSKKEVKAALDEAKEILKNPTDKITSDSFKATADDINEEVKEDTEITQKSINIIDSNAKELIINTNHTPVYAENFLQFSTLNENERKLYNVLVFSAIHFTNEVNVSYLKIPVDDIERIYKRFCADNPQFFYIARNFAYSYDISNDTVVKIRLYYTDGETTDVIDKNGKLTTTADRGSIRYKINYLNKVVAQILQNISADADQVTKEKATHDFLCNYVTYDKNVDVLDTDDEETVSDVFTVYGALCNGKAVCEGYAKAFQYLCNLVGINASRVIGESEGVGHMWNTVCIDGVWYHTDVTWDDTDKKKIIYDYFNLSTKQINKDHTITDKFLYVPECTAKFNKSFS